MAENNDWIEWGGGDADGPLPDGTRVEIQCRNGFREVALSQHFDWRHLSGSDWRLNHDIVAYRVIRTD